MKCPLFDECRDACCECEEIDDDCEELDPLTVEQAVVQAKEYCFRRKEAESK